MQLTKSEWTWGYLNSALINSRRRKPHVETNDQRDNTEVPSSRGGVVHTGSVAVGRPVYQALDCIA